MSLHMEREGPIESTIHLDANKLKSWSRWSSKSKEYLSNSGNKIKLSDLVNEYGDKILELNSWLNDALYKFHKSELKELESMKNEYNSKYRQV